MDFLRIPHELSATTILKKFVLCCMSEKDLVEGWGARPPANQQTSYKRGKLNGTFNEKKNIFADGSANINYFPLYLNVSSEDNVSMENTSKYS